MQRPVRDRISLRPSYYAAEVEPRNLDVYSAGPAFAEEEKHLRISISASYLPNEPIHPLTILPSTYPYSIWFPRILGTLDFSGLCYRLVRVTVLLVCSHVLCLSVSPSCIIGSDRHCVCVTVLPANGD